MPVDENSLVLRRNFFTSPDMKGRTDQMALVYKAKQHKGFPSIITCLFKDKLDSILCGRPCPPEELRM